MATNDKWYFTKEQLDGTPSRKSGYDSLKELSYRQQTANFIQDMGQRLKVSQLCINTAIVYMHRFYVFHSFTHFPWHQMAAAALFLAAKVEEQPRKLEYVIRVANMCRNNRDMNIDVNSERYIAQSQDLVFNENVLLQTLGFDVAIDHPHTHVVRCCQLVRASKDLAQTSYFLASNSLHLTTMCLQYKPTVVACFCIHLASKWSSWEIPLSSENKEWFLYVDPTVTADLLHQLTAEFLNIFESCPSRLKEKIMSIGDSGMLNAPAIVNSPFDTEPKKIVSADQKDSHSHRTHDAKSTDGDQQQQQHKHRSSRPHDSSTSSSQAREREYREKKLVHQQQQQQHNPNKNLAQKQPSGHHHRPAPGVKQPHASRPPSSGRVPEPRDILREAATRDSPFGIATKDTTTTTGTNNKQRDYSLLKPNAIADTNNYGYNGEKNRALPKVPMKHEQVRKHTSVPGHDRNAYTTAGKSLNLNAQQPPNKSSSAVKQTGQVNVNVNNKHHHNGNSNYNLLQQQQQQVQNLIVKEESVDNTSRVDCLPSVLNHNIKKDEVHSPVNIKKASLFSPEKSPVHNRVKTNNIVPLKSPIKQEVLHPLSPLKSPVTNRRSRNYSSGSEPELRPVMTKIDQVEGFENLMRDATIGIPKMHQVPDIITPISEVKMKLETSEPALTYSKEMKPPDIIPPLCSDNNISLVNGLETNPMLISSLLKEAPSIPHLTVVKMENSNTAHIKDSCIAGSKEHHTKSKKKNKDKHKHKDKDKSRDEKEKKKKHKDKDRERHKHKDKDTSANIKIEESPLQTQAPIKLKIHKDKIQGPIKITIAKDSIKSDTLTSNGDSSGSVSGPPMGIKIKIPRDKIGNCTPEVVGRKRERDSSRNAEGPPAKVSRSHNARDSKQNGRHAASYNSKVTQLGDGDASVHRLADSKHTNKSST